MKKTALKAFTEKHITLKFWKRIVEILLLLALLFGVIVIARSQTCTNPVITDMNPDPGICRAGDDYYLFTSTFNGGKYSDDQVDIQSTYDEGGGYNVGWVADNEWLVYTVDVNASFDNIEFRVSSSFGGRIKVEINDIAPGVIDIPETGGLNDWKTIDL